MEPKRIILLRHGESVGNVDVKVFRSIPDQFTELTSAGQLQAIDVGGRLNYIIPENETVKVYCSPYTRTMQTIASASVSCERSLGEIEYDPRLREREWANWFGDATSIPIDRKYNFFYRMPGGESCADVYDRVTCFINTMLFDLKKTPVENVLIVSHGTLIRAFIMRWFRMTVDEFYTIPNPKNCETIILEKDENQSTYHLRKALSKAAPGTVL
jgi:broad specificity phosphatase PhoE